MQREILVALHGLMGSAESWQPCLPLWEGIRVIALDLPGHGKNRIESGTHLNFHNTANSIIAHLRQQGIKRCTLLGYSLGGRMALHMALKAPEMFSRLVLESCSPGIIDIEERKKRAEDDEKRAEFIVRKGLEAFVKQWEELPLFASQKALSASILHKQRALRCSHEAQSIAAVLCALSVGKQHPLQERLKELPMPVLLVSGEKDVVYCKIVQGAAERIADAQVCIVPEAGHNVHLEQPERFARHVRTFIEGTEDLALTGV